MTTDVALERRRINTAEDGVRVILPVLRRPERAAIVYDSVRRSERNVPLRPLFMLSYGDAKELAAVEALGVDHAVLFEGRRSGDYARKINTAAACTSEPWIFTGADDLDFRLGWADAAIEYAEETKFKAIGVNDLGRWASRHKIMPAPHFLVHRSYLERGAADEPGVIFHTGYDHNYVDTEFMWTAHARGEYGYCAASVVEHLHPVWRKGRRDEVYQLGGAKNSQDLRLFRQREPLWKISRS